MFKKNKTYIGLIVLHLIIGVLIYVAPIFSKLYVALIILVGFLYVIKNKNNDNQVLIVASYQVGVEVFLRMTNGVPSYEFSKYVIIIYMLIGMYYSGVSRNAVAYWLYLILLIPGVIISTQTFSYDNLDLRRTIVFNLSGPVCLGIAALYCYRRNLSFKKLNQLLFFILLPILSTVVYLILYTPSTLKNILVTTSSNFNTSGGFGPNQVSTVLGLAMFILFSRIIFETKTVFILVVNLSLILVVSYRGLITFSRGGILTGLMMIIVLYLVTYLSSHGKAKVKLLYIFSFFVFMSVLLWSYSLIQTDGLIEKRYQNKDALGRVKENDFSGREKIASDELDMFYKNPFFGVGTARATDLRNISTGEVTASHDEITRMMAEHGLFGIVALLILGFTPLFLYIDNKQHLYIFSFLIFWFFTINHAAMRTASPAFIYALSLLKISFNEEKYSLHRK